MKPLANQMTKNLQQIPGVGPNITRDLIDVGIKSVSDLKNKDPEKLYQKLIGLFVVTQSTVVFYTFFAVPPTLPQL